MLFRYRAYGPESLRDWIYDSLVRRPGRLFLGILLVSVVLNLADWPYLDEIFGAQPTGVLSEIFGAQPPDKEPGQAGAHSKVRMGYQLLVSLQAVPIEQSIRMLEPQTHKAAVAVPRLLLSSFPTEIDRPPTLSSRS